MKVFIVIVAFISALLLSFILIFHNDWMMILLSRIFKFNSPAFIEKQYGTTQFRFAVPDGFSQNQSSDQKYPLVVYLHGGGIQGDDNRRQSYGLRFLGNGYNEQAKLYRSQYPSFVYVPQCPAGRSWQDPATLDNIIKTIETLKSDYPIDENRLYLIGYSMGGSGSYFLASRYFQRTGNIFAAIMRLAGQSSYDRTVHEIISKSSVWLHIGLQDTELRVAKAREAYAILKAMHPEGVESSEKFTVKNHPGTTLTLTVNKTEKVKKTEYLNDGHGIMGFPFEDPKLLQWLFNQNAKAKR